MARADAAIVQDTLAGLGQCWPGLRPGDRVVRGRCVPALRAGMGDFSPARSAGLHVGSQSCVDRSPQRMVIGGFALAIQHVRTRFFKAVPA